MAAAIALSFALWSNLAGAGALFDDPLLGLEPLSDAEMSSLRGGFITSDGIEITIGYEQAAFINGILQTKLALDISQLKRQDDVSDLAGSVAPVRVIQNGQGNAAPRFSTPLPDASYLTLIQNSLDHQTLQNLTVLNVDIKNIPSLHPSSFGNLINDQILNALH